MAISFGAENDVRAASGTPGCASTSVAAKWRWRFEYPALGKAIQGTETRVPTLMVPAGTDVEFEGESLDVVQRSGSRLCASSASCSRTGRRASGCASSTGFLASSRCSFFCGLHHQDMRFGVQVPRRAFRAWAARR